MKTIKLTLPYGPTVNHYWGQGRNGRRFLTTKAKYFRHAVWEEVVRVCPDVLNGGPILVGSLRFTLLVYPPDRRKRDLDNLIKPIWDALEHAGVFENDCQIKEMNCEMREYSENELARMEVTLEVL